MVRTRNQKRKLDGMQPNLRPGRSKRAKVEDKDSEDTQKTWTKSVQKNSHNAEKITNSSAKSKFKSKVGKNIKGLKGKKDKNNFTDDNKLVSESDSELQYTETETKVTHSCEVEAVTADKDSDLVNPMETEASPSKKDVAIPSCSTSGVSLSGQNSCMALKKVKSGKDESSSEESEWEDVEEANEEVSLDDYKPEIPKEGVQITLDIPDAFARRRKHCTFDFVEYLRRQVNRFRKDVQLSMHKVHLLCLIAHGIFVNNILNGPILKGLSLSVLPESLFTMCSKKFDMDSLEKLLAWYYAHLTYNSEKNIPVHTQSLEESLLDTFTKREVSCSSHYVFIFVAIARTLKLDVRVCFSLHPLPLKPSNLVKAKKVVAEEKSVVASTGVNTEMPNCKQEVGTQEMKLENSQSSKKSQSMSKSESSAKNLHVQSNCTSDSNSEKPRKKVSHKEKSPNEKFSKQEQGKRTRELTPNDEKAKYTLRPRSQKNTCSQDEASGEEGSEGSEWSTDDFVVEKKSRNHAASCKKLAVKDAKLSNEKCQKKKATKNRKVLSSDSEDEEEVAGTSSGIEHWVEIFVKERDQWICVDLVNRIIDKPYEIESHAPQPVKYILAINNKGQIKDVTKRYASKWLTSTRKQRIDEEWWKETLKPFAPPVNKQERKEEQQLNAMLQEQPLPATIGEYKNHPLYALKRHLLKFEAIYPPDAPPLGFIRKEPVYARECVHTLHSRETWLKQARTVKQGEEPYKLVKARPKWDKYAKKIVTDLPPTEVFGYWQTEPFVPPVAKDGKVPRNEYGNVELFHPKLLPRGTVYLQLPGLARVAKKLGIDCAPALVGFDISARVGTRPTYDGWVVCKEYKETLIAAWEEEQENMRKREEEKREKRVYGNWRKLIKGLLIRERLKLKYKKND